jgi:hypothetical protein
MRTKEAFIAYIVLLVKFVNEKAEARGAIRLEKMGRARSMLPRDINQPVVLAAPVMEPLRCSIPELADEIVVNV